MNTTCGCLRVIKGGLQGERNRIMTVNVVEPKKLFTKGTATYKSREQQRVHVHRERARAAKAPEQRLENKTENIKQELEPSPVRCLNNVPIPATLFIL